MQPAIQALLDTLGSLVSGVSPFAKAIVPSALALVTALVNMAIAGKFDTTSLVVLACGVVASVATYLIPNLEKKAKPAPAAPSAPSAPSASK